MSPEERARAVASKIQKYCTAYVPLNCDGIIATAIREAILAEREACAQVAEHPAYNIPRIAVAIRARGET